jgi:hypothetical protein
MQAREGAGGAVCWWTTNFGNPADIFIPVSFRKAQVLVQSKADIVAVKPVGCQPEVEEMLLQRRCDRGLSRGREAGEPDGATALPAEGIAFVPR